MKTILLTLLLALLSGILCAGQMTIAEFEQQIWILTNQQRMDHQLPLLEYEPGLADLARLHSRNMLNFGFFAHKDQLGDMVDERKVKYYPELLVSSIGENLARFYNPASMFTPEEIVEGWMNSPDHRDNILHADYTHLGVGVVLYGTVLIATQNFATPLVKLLTPLPKKISRKKSLKLEFAYLSPKPAENLNSVLRYPNRNLKYYLDNTHYTMGNQPLKIDWKDSRNLSVEAVFPACRGKYVLAFGFNNAYFEQGLVLKVK